MKKLPTETALPNLRLEKEQSKSGVLVVNGCTMLAVWVLSTVARCRSIGQAARRRSALSSTNGFLFGCRLNNVLFCSRTTRGRCLRIRGGAGKSNSG